MDYGIIVQARMDSTRLPGKVLMNLNGISLLECLLTQLKNSQTVDSIIVATTQNDEDNVIENFVREQQISIFRGNDLDVLDRYYKCAKKYLLKNIIRITADNPFIDPKILDSVVNLHKTDDYDYVNTFYKKSFPVGTEVEVFSFKVLEETWKKAMKPSEREHVTPYIYNNPKKFSIGFLENHENTSHLRWTVDKIEDLNFVTELFKRVTKQPILINHLLEIIKNEPNLLEINQKIKP